MQIVKATMIDRILADEESALKANKVATQFGLKPAKNKAHLRDNLIYLVRDKNASEQALLRLAKVHPDRELILEAEKINTTKKQNNMSGDDTLNCSGCASATLGCDGCGGNCGKMNGDGDGGIATYSLTEDHEVKLRGGASKKFAKGSVIKGVVDKDKLYVEADVYIPKSKLKLISEPVSSNKFKAFIDNYGKVVLLSSVVLISAVAVFRATRSKK